MILASRPRFRASGRPQGPGYQGFQQAYRTTVSPDFGIPGFSDYRVLRAAPKATVQGVPAEAFLRAGFRCPDPSWNPSEALPYESLPCESPGWPPGWQTSPEPVSTAIVTKDNLRQYVAPLRLAPEGETTIIMVAVYWEDNPEDLLQRLEEIHRGDQPPRMGEIPGETPGDHINRKKRKRSGARVKTLRTYRENENPRIAAGIFLWDTLQLVLSSPKL